MDQLPDSAAFARRLLALEADEAFIRLVESQTRTNFFRILGTDDRERWHSAFWAWLMDPLGSHGLGDTPLRQLLIRAFGGYNNGPRCAHVVFSETGDLLEEQPSSSQALRLADILRLRVTDAVVAPGPLTRFREVTGRELGTSKTSSPSGDLYRRDKGRFDLLLFASGEHPSQPGESLVVVVVVEVKFKAGYSAEQLVDYSNWLHKCPSPENLVARDSGFIDRAVSILRRAHDGERASGVWSFGYFLSPERPEKLKPVRPEDLAAPWTSLTFHELISEVLEPALENPRLASHARPMLQAYLDLAAHPDTEIIDVPPSEHRNLVEELVKRHEDTFRIIAKVFAASPDDEERHAQADALNEALDTTMAKDFTKYDVDVRGQVFPRLAKRNAVHRVFMGLHEAGADMGLVSQAVESGKVLILPGKLTREQVLQAPVSKGGKPVSASRWFCSDEQIVWYADNTYVLSNQWGFDILPMMQHMIAAAPGCGVSVIPSRL